MQYDMICLLPILLILLTAFLTKRTLLAMVCGLACASLIQGGLPGFADSFFGNLYASLSNESLQWIVIMISIFGILLTLLDKSEAVTDFGFWAGKFIRTRKAAQYGAFVLGLVVSVDDYLNNLAVSTTMKGITDRYHIPRVQLGYIVNTMAAPVCLLFPVSTWAVYFAALMGDQGVTLNGSSMAAYIHGLPYAFYGWFAVLVCVLQFTGVLPELGYMKKAYRSVESHTGSEKEDAPAGKENAGPWNFILPLAVLIVISVTADVLLGASAAVVLAVVMVLAERKMSFSDLLTACYDGVMSMGFIMILSVLAFAVQNANVELGLAEYVISVAEPLMKGGFLPAVVFLVCAVYAYATGCFWDLAAIIMPIVIPLANVMGVDPIIASAAVFSGAAFGSNTCLYGDGIILCSQGCRVEPMELMRATLPYATIAGACAFAAYLIVGLTM